MAYEHKPGEFTVFRNDRKTSEQQPDWKGRGRDIDGTPKDIAFWEREGKNGTWFKVRLSDQLPRGASERDEF